MNHRIVLCALLLSPSSSLLSAGNFASDKVIENDQPLSPGEYMATGFWLVTASLLGYRVAGVDNLLKQRKIEDAVRARLEKIQAGAPFIVSDVFHEFKFNFYDIKRQSTIIGAKKAVSVPVGVAGLCILGQGIQWMYNRCRDAALRVAENHQKAKTRDA